MARTRPPALHLDAELDRQYRGDRAADPRTLATLVAGRVRRTGRHHLGSPLLDALGDLQDRLGDGDVHLDAFLTAVLGRHRNRFCNQTYLALPLVELVRVDLGVDPQTMSALLVADVVRHEREVTGALDARTRAVRIRHALRFVAAAAPGVDVAHEPGGWFALTALPVSTEHDEYFFIRVLQAHEMVFTTMTDLLRAATAALRADDVPAATAHLARAAVVLDQAALLFRLVATVRPAAFHSFRRYTEGASAIQSESYKRFEIACGTPSPPRLAGEAFAHVPVVRAEVPHLDDFSAAWREVGADGADGAALATAVTALERGHRRWKGTHHSLAASMLGDAPGSGYTEGVPYLRRWLDERLFSAPGGGAGAA
ncbi:hypothetical protein H7X46_14095 [Pseudonocardia sp. C8]|uniref:tryptophan 2,3-dioxygenase family protein n=1 Tax=Pseudonocardia sp. C8 TaxID=2762759 RepID=UPI0016426D8E|nr:tryptophan 2,3-dioxygenase family protein [Pseudonocardia sp. C8]MBC3192193.1 hypothetical protein [Pseudonocardia sp. C8]